MNTTCIGLKYALERVLIAKGHGREADTLQKVDLHAHAHRERQVKRHSTVDVVQRESESETEDGKPNNSAFASSNKPTKVTGNVIWTAHEGKFPACNVLIQMCCCLLLETYKN
jgi:hypothetical protein